MHVEGRTCNCAGKGLKGRRQTGRCSCGMGIRHRGKHCVDAQRLVTEALQGQDETVSEGEQREIDGDAQAIRIDFV